MSKHIFMKNGLLELIFQEPAMLDKTGGVGGI